MVRNLGNAILLVGAWMATGMAIGADDRPRELDAALGEVKRDMLSLGDRIHQLSQGGYRQPESVSIYLSAEPDLSFRLEKIVLGLNGDTVSEVTLHDDQRRALKRGGAARIHRGTLFQGRSRLEVVFVGRGADGNVVEYRKQWNLEQSPGAHAVVELHLDNAHFRHTPAVDMRVVD